MEFDRSNPDEFENGTPSVSHHQSIRDDATTQAIRPTNGSATTDPGPPPIPPSEGTEFFGVASNTDEEMLPENLRPWWTDDAEIQTWMMGLVAQAQTNVEVLSQPDQLRRQAILFIHQDAKRDVLRQQLKKARLPLGAWKKAEQDAEKELRAELQQTRREQDLNHVYQDMDRGMFDSWQAIKMRVLDLAQKHDPEDMLMSPPIQELLIRGLDAGIEPHEIAALGQQATQGCWTKRRLTEWVQAMVRQARTKKAQGKASKHGLSIVDGNSGDHVADDLPPTFDGMIIPDGYRVTRHGVIQITYDELGDPVERPIALRPLVILRHLVNTDTDQEYAELAWLSPHVPDQWKRRIVSAGVINGAQTILQLGEYGAPVNSNNAKNLIAYLDAFAQINAHRYPLILATARLGWQKQSTGFVAGIHRYFDHQGQPGAVEFLADSAGDQQKAEGFHPRGDFAGWLSVLNKAQRYPAVMLAVLASLATPLLQIVEAPNFVLDYGGNTSTGKTTTLELAASVWGQPDLKAGPAAMFSWASTHVGVETLSQLISGLPTILDDTKTVHGNPRKVTEIVYGVVSGMGKMRGAKAGGSRAVGHWRTILMSSGEQSITSFTAEGGVKTRTIAVTERPFGEKKQTQLVQTVKREVRQHYGHAGAAFVQWLLQHRDQWKAWAHDYQVRLIDLSHARSEGSARLMEYRALLELAASLLDQAWSSLEGVTWTWGDLIAHPTWEALWNTFEERASDPLDLRRALRQLGSWAQAHSEEFMGRRTDAEHPPLKWVGQWKLESQGREAVDELCIYTHVLEKLLQDWGYFPESVIDGWYEQRWLRRDPDGKHRLPQIVITDGPDAGRRKRVFFVLSSAGLQIAFGDDENATNDDEASQEPLAGDEANESLDLSDDSWDLPF